MTLVEQWEDAVQREIDPEQVLSIEPQPDQQGQHYHPGFGRAERWQLTFKDRSTMFVNGCAYGLEQYKIAEPA